MEPFSFDRLPEVIRELFEKVERIEQLLTEIQPPEAAANDLLTVQEAADYLKVSVQSLYSKVSRMEIPVSKPGKRLYFSKADLKKWVIQARRKTTQELVAVARDQTKLSDKRKDFY